MLFTNTKRLYSTRLDTLTGHFITILLVMNYYSPIGEPLYCCEILSHID